MIEKNYQEYKKWYFTVHPNATLESMAIELHAMLVEHAEELSRMQDEQKGGNDVTASHP